MTYNITIILLIISLCICPIQKQGVISHFVLESSWLRGHGPHAKGSTYTNKCGLLPDFPRA